MPKRGDFWANFSKSASRTSQATGSQVAVDTARQMLAELLALPDKEKERAIADLRIEGEKQRQAGVAEEAEQRRSLFPLQKKRLEADITSTEALGEARSALAAQKGGALTTERLANEKMKSAILANPALYDTIPPSTRAKLLPELVAGGFKYLGKPLGVEAMKTRENALSGIRAIQQFRKETEGVGGVAKLAARAVVPGDLGARKLSAAAKEMKDVLTRLRTGAAINDRELTFYESQVPGFLDLTEPGAIEYKLSLFQNLFTSLTKQQRTGATAEAEEPSGAAALSDDALMQALGL